MNNKNSTSEQVETPSVYSKTHKDLITQDPVKRQQFFQEISEGNDPTLDQSSVISATDLFSETSAFHQSQTINESQDKVTNNAQSDSRLQLKKQKSRICWLLIGLLFFFMAVLIKSADYIISSSSNENKETQSNLHAQIEQSEKISNAQIYSQISINQLNGDNQINQTVQASHEQNLTKQGKNIDIASALNDQNLTNQTLNEFLNITSNTAISSSTENSSTTKDQPELSNTVKQSVKNATDWKIRQKFRQKVPPVNQNIDLYEFKQSSNDLVTNSALKKFYNDSPWPPSQIQYGVEPAEHQRAIRLIEVTHNVNFKGQFVFDHFDHYNSGEEKYQTLKKLLDQQKKYYETKYEISKYIQNQLRFCVFVTSYNNMKNRIYLRNLDSIFQQQYKNYHVIYVNDASNDGTKEYVQNYMEQNEIPSNIYTLINNEKNMLNTHNTYMAAHNQCKLGQIMALVDGDDALIGRQVFSLLNAFYQREKPALVYTQLLFIYPSHIGNSRNQPINTTIFQTTGAWRKQMRFCTSHLKTFYVDLFRMIKKEDLQFEKDEWIPHSPDVAYMTLMLEMAGRRVKFLTEITYEYRHDTNTNEPVEGFRKVNPKIFAKKPYSLVKELPFADNQITTFYP